MTSDAKKQYLQNIYPRYLNANRPEKKQILDEFCTVCHYHRKYAIRLLNAPKPTRTSPGKGRRGPKRQYENPQILKVIKYFWRLTNLPCSKKLKVILQVWLPYYPYYLPVRVEEKLLSISPATMDRLMKPMRSRFQKRGLATTKPGSILKKHIPVKTHQWDEIRPGFLEADTLAHCGNSMAGMFVYSVNCVDIASGWSAQQAVWGKGERGVLTAIHRIEESLPFPILGFDCDNGSEFLNWHLFRHFSNRKKPIQFTRSRPYHKNDNAHIEEKNWSILRQYLGYQRFDNPQLVDRLNDLYASQWHDYFNFFIPTIKLREKYRQGARIIKKYDRPQTAYQRLAASPYISPKVKKRLHVKFQSLNPIHLQKQMAQKIKNILKVVNETSELLRHSDERKLIHETEKIFS